MSDHTVQRNTSTLMEGIVRITRVMILQNIFEWDNTGMGRENGGQNIMVSPRPLPSILEEVDRDTSNEDKERIASIIRNQPQDALNTAVNSKWS